MERYPMYKVFIPDFCKYEGASQKTALRHYIMVDGDSLIFETSSGFDKMEPIMSFNCQARLVEVYTAMVAVAYRLRWIRKYPAGAPTRKEKIGNINGRRVARIVDYERVTVSRVEISKKDLVAICGQYLNPDQNNFFFRAVTAEISREEDYVKLSLDEKLELIREAKKILRDTEPLKVSADGTHAYRFDLSEFDFAPNTVWTSWALQNAHYDDQKWYRVVFEVDYQNRRCNISWRNTETEKKPTLRVYGSSYFAQFGKNRRTAE